MNDAMYIAATGLQTQQLNVDTIANNMANAVTPGFKSGRVNFQELMHRDALQTAGAVGDAGSGIARGTGVGVGSLLKNFSAGEVKATGNELDLAIRGDGFIEVQLGDGSTGYWRGGTVQVTAEGWLATSQGQLIKPQIRVGKDAKGLLITPEGRVLHRAEGVRDVELGQLDLHVFSDPSGLRVLGDGLYQSTSGSGDAMPLRPGADGAGTFMQGYAEQSNVKLVDEMVNLMLAQRAYEMNVKVIQAADEMLGMSNNMRK
jgi:flagellar basal-body rod protein FlgG